MKKLYLTYQDYQVLGSLINEMQYLCSSLMSKRGIITANEKEQRFVLEGQFNEKDIAALKKYGWREI